MAVDLKEVFISLDLNPLMVLPGKGGVRVVDVVMEIGKLSRMVYSAERIG